jgi:hypothetical protein
MKSVATAVCLSVLMLALGQAAASADELDDLLSGSASGVEVASEPADQPAVAETTSPDSPREEVDLDYTNHARWQPIVALPNSADGVSAQPRTAEAPSAFSAVPEPSAIALALLAFVYFLVFGRRRFAA